MHKIDHLIHILFYCQIKQVKHKFPFGGAAKAEWLYGNSSLEKKYQNKFFELFNWGVLRNDMKWKAMERVEVRKY